MVRKDIIDIIKDIRSFPEIKTIAMTTNGSLLSRRIEKVKEAGMNNLNISLDTLVEAKNDFITRRPLGWKKTMQVFYFIW